MNETYTARTVEDVTVVKIEDNTIEMNTGFWIAPPKEVLDRLEVGSEFLMESRGFNTITGWMIDGEWLARKSDQDLEREQQEWRDKWDAERKADLEAHEVEWQQREDALPDWIKERIAVFHERGGEHFRTDGWGYELIVAELAVLYLASDGEDSPAVDEYARVHGTSGNQHGCAQSLAKAHANGRTVAQTVSALVPLTGEPFYEKR